MPSHTDPVGLCVDLEIESMRTCLEFGRSSSLAEEHPQCLLALKWVGVVMKATRNWDTESSECVIFLKMVCLLPGPSAVMFVRVCTIQCKTHAAFAFAPPCLNHHAPGGYCAWFICCYIDKGCLFTCYKVGRGGSGVH